MKDEKFARPSRLNLPNLKLTVQQASDRDAPSRAAIRCWIKAALESGAEITVRFINEPEARRLNEKFRGRDYATNVLSFLYQAGPPFSGDIALCLPLARKEARELRISVEARIAHLLVHAALHLQGYDHEVEEEAEAMEQMETEILRKLGFSDPYVHQTGIRKRPRRSASSRPASHA